MKEAIEILKHTIYLLELKEEYDYTSVINKIRKQIKRLENENLPDKTT